MGLTLRGTSEFKGISVEDTFRLLETRADGLTESEAEIRLETFGFNEVVEKKKNPLLEFLLRFWGPMSWLLELAMVLAAVLGHILEAIIIFVLLTTNAVIGFLNDYSAQKALSLLKKRLAVKARVLREGKWLTKEARSIVPGDVVVVGLGDLVPADAKIVNGEVSIDQSALTGESLPVNVGPTGLIYAGSVIRRGEAKSIVINTGKSTYFGRTAEMVKVAKPKSHQEEIMMSIVKYMMLLGGAAVVLVSIYALKRNIGVLAILTFIVVFLMGAVPVALPAVLTIVQAVGATELARKKVLVTRLDSIEDAASIDILCLDKTGTITQNELSVSDVIPVSGYKKEDVLLTASLASREEGGDAIDLAVIRWAKTAGLNLSLYTQVSFSPFDPSSKRAEAVIEAGDKRFRAVKGAPQIIMPLCRELAPETRVLAEKTVEALSHQGFRALAVARAEGDSLDDLQLIGLLSLADPPRPDSKSWIEEIKREGIKIILLTGDNVAIARQIAGEVGIGDKIIRLADIKDLSETEQARIVEECDGFAEVYPEDKYRTVKLLQSRKHMVGMTGDGVNDAPALRQAEMGIAVSNATDVAKASASMVLVGQGLRVITDAIKTSRQIYQRMLTWVLNKITKTVQFIGLLTIGFFWLHEVVISLLGMSLLVFSNDFVTMSLATDNVKQTRNPNEWNVKNITLASLVLGFFLVAEGALAILIGLNYFHLGPRTLRTFLLLVLIFTSQFRVCILRERGHFWSLRPGKSLLTSTAATIIVFAIIGTSGLIIPALPFYQVLTALGLSAVSIFCLDFPKYYVFKKFRL